MLDSDCTGLPPLLPSPSTPLPHTPTHPTRTPLPGKLSPQVKKGRWACGKEGTLPLSESVPLSFSLLITMPIYI